MTVRAPLHLHVFGHQCGGDLCHGYSKRTLLIMWTSFHCWLTKQAKQAATPGSEEQVAPAPHKLKLTELKHMCLVSGNLHITKLKTGCATQSSS